jgi:hypothetical protein
MASKKSDVKFKYVNVIPQEVNSGTFYWKYEDGHNQLYFSPTDDRRDILRLDNIISGESGSMVPTKNIVLVGIYDAPDNTNMMDQNTGETFSWSDSDWENYVKDITESSKYGNLSEKPFVVGNVVVCGNREFICKSSKPSYETTDLQGIIVYMSKNGGVCEDENGNPITVSSGMIPDDVLVVRYDTLIWETFGDNLSQELAQKIADFNMEIYGSATINVDATSDGEYTLSVVLKEQNPLTLSVNQDGDEEFTLSDPNDDGDQILMSANQIKEMLNEAIPKWRNNL